MQEETQIKRNFDSIPGSGAVYKLVDYIAGWSRKYSIWHSGTRLESMRC